MANTDDILADFENRISFLENSLPGSAMTSKEEENQEEVKQPDKSWSKRQWDTVQQLRGEMANLKKKFVDLEKQIPLRKQGVKYK